MSNDPIHRIAEYSGTTLEKTYLWGMDLSGTMQGAGGIGGLLSVKSGSAVHYPTFDGNGNVSEYLDSVGAVAAHFEYDPFGNLTIDTHGNAAAFPCRFSTKPQDPITGLYYYIYRHYDPVTGRWLNKDPIAERGGVNLYGFVGNDSLSRWDLLGMQEGEPSSSCPPSDFETVDQETTTNLIGENPQGGFGGFVDRETGTPRVNRFNPVRDGRTETSSGESGYFARCRVVEVAKNEGEDLRNGRDVWSGSPGGVGPQAANALGYQSHGIINDMVNKGMEDLGLDLPNTAYVDLDADYKLTICWKACDDDTCAKPKCKRAYILTTLEITKIRVIRAYTGAGNLANPQPKFKEKSTVKKAYKGGCL